MRHLTGIVLAIVMAAGLFFAATWGYVRFGESSRLPGGAAPYTDHHALLGLGALAAVGLLAGILIAAPRVSPLAAGLPGLLLLGLTALYLVSAHRADQLIPLKSHVFGAGFESLLARGILGAVALAMLVPLFVPSRWRDRDGAEVADEFGLAATEETELVGVITGAGADVPGVSADVRMAEAAAGPGEPAARAAQPARAAAPAMALHHGVVPHRTRPPGIVY